ncbi:MAG: hypothetical protein GPJ51_11080 [Candidatus Heimdallarchaeota archaeon]|nr:hypothetical protein [Candidatus Heimdallarchaeota archaeon]
MSQVIQEFESFKEKIRFLLHKYPSARDSDKMLHLHFLKHFTDVEINFIPSFEVLKTIPSTDTIARTKRHIQNTELDSLAQPSHKVKESRKKAEPECREYFGKINRS